MNLGLLGLVFNKYMNRRRMKAEKTTKKERGEKWIEVEMKIYRCLRREESSRMTLMSLMGVLIYFKCVNLICPFFSVPNLIFSKIKLLAKLQSFKFQPKCQVQFAVIQLIIQSIVKINLCCNGTAKLFNPHCNLSKKLDFYLEEIT